MTNLQIAKLLRNVAASYAITNEGKFRFQIIAYQRAADAIEGSTSELQDLYKEGRLATIPGVGPSIAQHLEELFKTGKVKHFDFVMKDIPDAVFPLLDVPSFGPKKAFRLVKEFHLKNPKTVIDEIERIAKSGKIADLEGFGEKSQSDILRAIEEFRMGKGKTKRMVLPFAAELADKLVKYLKKSPAVIDAVPLGSLRRRKETIGDVDIAVSTEKPKEALEHFVNYPYKERLIERGDVGASLLVSGGKQVDLLTVPKRQFGSLLQHFTGSKNHNIHLREYALKKGMSLSERGIKKQTAKSQDPIAEYDTEEKFYHALGMNWIPPEIREDTGEIELALKHNLPKLVELQDIKADFHIHSNYPIEPSHDLGKDTMEDMLRLGKKLGYSYMGFSEHNPSISKHTKTQIYALLEKRKEKIEQLKASKKYIHIVSLMETDIQPNGSLALDEKALSYLDATIVSVHSSFSMNKKDMTRRVLSGLSHPKAKILAHPTGRLLNDRAGYELEWDQLFDFCKKHNKALEINAWPQRLDLPDVLVQQAMKYGIKFTIDTDSHALDQMNNMQFGVSVARRGWARSQDILNCMEYNEFIQWLKT